jgi:hypothetical protein
MRPLAPANVAAAAEWIKQRTASVTHLEMQMGPVELPELPTKPIASPKPTLAPIAFVVTVPLFRW